jgi:hypothetical protein
MHQRFDFTKAFFRKHADHQYSFTDSAGMKARAKGVADRLEELAVRLEKKAEELTAVVETQSSTSKRGAETPNCAVRHNFSALYVGLRTVKRSLKGTQCWRIM